MKRVIVLVAVLVSGVFFAPAAHAAPSTSSCIERARFTWTATQYFNPGDCYQTPGAALTMQFDGNFVVYKTDGGICSSNTSGAFGAYAVFQGDGNLVVYYNGQAIASTRTDGNPNSRLILRGDGTLLIRNEAGAEIFSC